MLISALLGPGTIFLMTVGAISISFDLDIFLSFVVIVSPVVVFAAICLTCRQETQVGLFCQSNYKNSGSSQYKLWLLQLFLRRISCRSKCRIFFGSIGSVPV